MSIARFEKVSFEQFKKDWLENIPIDKTQWTEEEIKELYEKVQLPTRSTKKSAGYDFKTYFDFSLAQGQTIKVPSGIRAIINHSWFLALVPRSGHGFKYRIQLDNTVGIIDADYSESSNEGHIFVKLTNDGHSNKVLKINADTADGYVQGIFLPYGLADEDEVITQRDGGMGSTTKK